MYIKIYFVIFVNNKLCQTILFESNKEDCETLIFELPFIIQKRYQQILTTIQSKCGSIISWMRLSKTKVIFATFGFLNIIALIEVFKASYKLNRETQNFYLGRDENNNCIMTFDSSRITHVYHLGWDGAYGRMNNQIITILHAVDLAIDSHGEPPNNHAVVAIDTWAFEILNSTLGQDENSFALDLVKLCPVMLMHKKRLPALGLTKHDNKTHINITAQDSYFYIRHNKEKYTPQIIESRRQLIWGELLRHGVAERNQILYKGVNNLIESRSMIYGEGNRKKYVTIHSRSLEGECQGRAGDSYAKDDCFMSPSYIKAIMRGMINMPIVFILDGQNKTVLENLKMMLILVQHLFYLLNIFLV